MIRASRRCFIGAVAGSLGGVIVVACAPSPPPPPTAVPAAQPTAAPPTPAPAPQAAAPPAAKSAIELTIWDAAHDPKTSIKYWDEVYDAYNKVQNKVTVKGVHGQGTEKILAALTAGQAPDVIFMWDGQEPLGAWAQQGLIIPIDDQVKARNFDLGQIHPAALATCKYRNKLYGVPELADGMFYFANVAKVKEAGLDPAKPAQNWNEWLEWSVKLTKKDSAGNVTQLGSAIPSGWARYNVIWAFGGQLFDSSGTTATPDDPGVIEALTFLRGYADKVGVDAVKRFSAGLGKNVSPDNPFIVGQLPTNIDGEWTLRYLREFKPEWQLDRDFTINAVPYPAGKPELAKSMHLADYPWVIGKGAKHLEESVDWMLWTMGSKETQVTVSLNMMNLSTSLPALQDSRMLKAPGFGMNVQIFQESKNVKSLPVTAATALMDDLFNKEADIIIDGKEDVREGMKKVKDKVQAELDKYR